MGQSRFRDERWKRESELRAGVILCGYLGCSKENMSRGRVISLGDTFE
jgi:hypothetical protein